MPGQFLFINSEILGQHSVGIDTAFATMGYLLAQFSVVLVQPIAPIILLIYEYEYAVRNPIRSPGGPLKCLKCSLGDLIEFLTAYSCSTSQAISRHNLVFPLANFIIDVF